MTTPKVWTKYLQQIEGRKQTEGRVLAEHDEESRGGRDEPREKPLTKRGGTHQETGVAKMAELCRDLARESRSSVPGREGPRVGVRSAGRSHR